MMPVVTKGSSSHLSSLPVSLSRLRSLMTGQVQHSEPRQPKIECYLLKLSRFPSTHVRFSRLRMVANPARVQLNLVSRKRFGLPVPLTPHTPAEPGAYSRAPFLPSTFRERAHLYRKPPSGQSGVYRVTQVRADGVHRRHSKGTRSIVLKITRVTDAAYSGNPGTN